MNYSLMILLSHLILGHFVFAEENKEAVTEWESVAPNENKTPVNKSLEKTKEPSVDTKPNIESNLEVPKALTLKNSSSRSLRGHYTHSLLLNYSLIDTWIPGKYGGSYVISPSEYGSWELEYLRGTISVPIIIEDLGKITDQRLTLMYRSFSQRNSFNYLYGLNYSSFTFELGIDYLSTISGGNVGSYDLVSVKTLGLTWGLGNRWQFNSAVLSFDWFTINIPVIVLESEAPFLEANASEQSKKDIRDVLDFMEKFPTFAILKFQIGVSF